MSRAARAPLVFVAAIAAGSCSASPLSTAGEGAARREEALDVIDVGTIMAHARAAGLPCDALVLAGAVAMGESEGYIYATHWNGATGDCPWGSTDLGLWQINDCYWPAWAPCAFDPTCNAEAMAAISNYGQSFQLWLAFTNGRYLQFLDLAEAAYAAGVADCAGGGSSTTGGGNPGGGGGAQCDALGYEGECVGEVSLWSEGGVCRVRDCGGEGKACGLISAADGYGCLGGTAGATTADCSSFGYDGACLSETLVWAEDGACRAVHCPDDGRTCGWDEGVGYNCL